MFINVTTSPGFWGLRPTRLVVWIYSAAVLGWPSTTINPSRTMSSPTEIMLVARAISTESFSWKGVDRRRLVLAI